jgi:hypothetical protein
MHSVIAAVNLVSEVSRFLSLSHTHSLIVKENKKKKNFKEENRKKRRRKKEGKKKRSLFQYSRICAVDPPPTAKGAALRQQGAGEL